MLDGKLIQYQNSFKWYTYIISFTHLLGIVLLNKVIYTLICLIENMHINTPIFINYVF